MIRQVAFVAPVGSPKENVLLQDAPAWINYRITPCNCAREVMQPAQAHRCGTEMTAAVLA